MHVQRRAADPSLLQRLRQGLLIHQPTPGRVHQEGALSHLEDTARGGTDMFGPANQHCTYEPCLCCQVH